MAKIRAAAAAEVIVIRTAVFLLLFALTAFEAELAIAGEEPICPSQWKAGYEFMYPSFCQPQGSQSRLQISERERQEVNSYRLPPTRASTEFPESIDYSELKTKTKYLAAVSGFFLYAVLGSLPEDATNWQGGGNDFDRWEKNIRRLPHMDSDGWLWNYVAHPLAGSAYYTLCMEGEFTKAQCLFYSFMVSAFIWEYGFEAGKERPSIQDLIITPAAGALVGEIARKLTEEIRENDGKVLGSKVLGGTFLTLLNPLGSLIHTMRSIVEPITRNLGAQIYLTYAPDTSRDRFNRLYMSDYYRSLYASDERLSLTLKIPFQVDWRGRIRLGR